MSKRNNQVSTNTNKQHAQNQLVAIQGQQYSGPIPPPEILQGFENIVPGSAERILRMAEENGKHQRELESKALDGTYKTIKTGQIFGFIIGIVALLSSVVALFLGSEIAASIIGGTTVVGLVTVFVTGRFIESKNNDPNN